MARTSHNPDIKFLRHMPQQWRVLLLFPLQLAKVTQLLLQPRESQTKWRCGYSLWSNPTIVQVLIFFTLLTADTTNSL
jgi:hypothetical protein